MFGNTVLNEEEMKMPTFFDIDMQYYTPADDTQLYMEATASDAMHFHAEIMDQDRFIKVNNIKEVSNPVFFVRAGVPTPDGLLSNEIFGITSDERAGTFAYIDLGGTYIDPSCYKALIRVEPKFKSVVHGLGEWIINDKGELEEVESGGSCGIDFIKKNIDKIKFKRTDSQKRNLKINYIEKNKDRMFITKYFVIPAYYRDVNTEKSKLGVGQINKLYAQLITLAKSPKENSYYGLSRANAVAGRIQETILVIYDLLSGNTNSAVTEPGAVLSGKQGIIRKAVMSHTTDYASRLVLSSPDLKKETRSDIMVDLDHVALPLAVACTDFYPYIIFNVKRFFENEFSAYAKYPVLKKDGTVEYVDVKDPLVEFSEERITKELKRFLHGYSNRFIPIEIPVEDDGKKNKEAYYMAFKGRNKSPKDAQNEPEAIYNRRLTWCDVFFMAAVEACKDKMCLITRYPMDSRHNQFPCGIVVNSTKDTEPMYVGNTYYKFYPVIREEDIGKDTSSAFVDTLIMSNLYLDAIGGDYDGDTATAKGAYTVESNEELRKYAQSKANYLDFGCNIIRVPKKESLISLYVMTLTPKGTKLTQPEF